MASTAWERRNARARAKGFRNYYEQRTRKVPGGPKPSRDELRRRRGHAGLGDLNRLVRAGRVELINVVQVNYDPPTFDLLCTLQDGSQRSFTLKGEAPIRRFRATLDDMGPDAPQLTGSPSSLRRLLEDDELEELEAAGVVDAERGEEGDEPYEYTETDIPF